MLIEFIHPFPPPQLCCFFKASFLARAVSIFTAFTAVLEEPMKPAVRAIKPFVTIRVCCFFVKACLENATF